MDEMKAPQEVMPINPRLSHTGLLPTALVALLLMALLVACGASQDERVFNQAGQEFHIIPAYEGQSSYLEEAQSTSEDAHKLWREYVVEPYREDCVADSEYTGEAERYITEPILDLERLSHAVNTLRASDVQQLVEGGLRNSSRKLGGPDTNVCIFVASDYQSTYAPEGESGVGGFTAGSGKILLFVNPSEEDWKKWTPYVVAHEYHHSVWTERHLAEAQPLELADYLIFEGRADSFAHLVYPGKVAPHSTALTSQEETQQWKAMKEDLDSTDQQLWAYYAFGGPGIPRWTLYTIGFDVVQSYLASHPDQSIRKWTALDARKLLEESGYTGHQR